VTAEHDDFAHDDLRKQVEALQLERQESRDHRTTVRVYMSLAGAAALVVILGAVSVRDTARETAARVVALEARVAAEEASATRRDTEDRATSAAIVRLQATLEALQSTIARRLDAIDQRLTTPR
jgi:hypothetical protein